MNRRDALFAVLAILALALLAIGAHLAAEPCTPERWGVRIGGMLVSGC